MTILGKYELHEPLGKGSFGTVYRAIDISLGREVALKILHPQLMVEQSFVDRFKKEAYVLAALDHPNIVTIYELCEFNGRIFIAMRYLAGGNLEQRLQKEKRISYPNCLAIMKQVCEGLQVAHLQGLVHRDIKPANILFDARGNAVVSDFGLARAVQVSQCSTVSSGVAGTPAYRAPELWRGRPPAAPASDVYSLACVLAEMLSGKILFNGDTTDKVITQHLVEGPQLSVILPPGLPGQITAVLSQALSKEMENRPVNAGGFLNALPPVRSEQPKAATSIPTQSKSNIDIRKSSLFILGHSRIIDETCRIPTLMSMDFMRVPAGEFLMGNPGPDEKRYPVDECPQHKVFLDEFWIGKFPVNCFQYFHYLEEIKLEDPFWNYEIKKEGFQEKFDHPIITDWVSARNFCKWLSEKTHRRILLPSEAQWEKAARGVDGRIFPWGNQPASIRLANFNLSNEGGTTKNGLYPQGAGPYGTMDMAGNVLEWVMDWYDPLYYSNSPVNNPMGPDFGKEKVLRGGSWISTQAGIRTTARFHLNLDHSSSGHSGFRCVMIP